MPRYLFHIDGDNPYRDKVGEDLPDDAAAWREAMRLARDIEDTLQPGQGWLLEVEENGVSVYLVAITTHHRRH